MAMPNQKKNTQFAVLGLGRFGYSIVKTLGEHDVHVLACDNDPARLHDVIPYATQVIQVDLADENAVKSLGLGNFDVVVINLGNDFEASLIDTMLAKEAGVKEIVVKGRGRRQRQILESVGATRVVQPEIEMGGKIARQLVGSNIADVLEESEHYTIAEVHPKPEWIGKSIRQADIRRTSGLMVLGLRRGGKLTIPAPPDRVIEAADLLITLSEHEA